MPPRSIASSSNGNRMHINTNMVSNATVAATRRSAVRGGSGNERSGGQLDTGTGLRRGLGPSKLSNANRNIPASASVHAQVQSKEDEDEKLQLHQQTQQTIPENNHPRSTASNASSLNTTGSNSIKLRVARFAALVRNAASQGMLDSAIFWGQLLLALSDNPSHIALVCQSLQSKCEFAYVVNTIRNSATAMRDPPCRSILAHCLIHLNESDDAMETLLAPLDTSVDPTTWPVDNPVTDARPIAVSAYNSYLKGKIHFSMNELGPAKAAYIDALRTDVRCYEALLELISCNLLTIEDEQNLLNTLPFASHCGHSDADLVQSLYLTQLRIHPRLAAYETALHSLETTHSLSFALPILQSRAALQTVQANTTAALATLSRIRSLDPHNPRTLHTHITLLTRTRNQNALFLLAHELARTQPGAAGTWLAIGCYELQHSRAHAARAAFTKAARLDAGLGEAWVGLGHAHASEGAGDVAVQAYARAARCWLGRHEPTMFIGMQYMQMGQVAAGEEYLHTAMALCDTDPMLLNEVGVLAYQRDDCGAAVRHFLEALKAAGKEATRSEPFSVLWYNLGNAYRRLRAYLAMVLDRLGDLDEALARYHESLALDPENSLIQDLMDATLRKRAESGFPLFDHTDENLFDLHALGLLSPPSWMSTFARTSQDATAHPPSSTPSAPALRSAMSLSDDKTATRVETPQHMARKGLLFGVTRDPRAGAILLNDYEDEFAWNPTATAPPPRGPETAFAVPRVTKATYVSFASSSPAMGSAVSRASPEAVPFSFGGGRSVSARGERKLSPAIGEEGLVGVTLQSASVRRGVGVLYDEEAGEEDMELD
ncbi:hypothetical protein BC830DRAFT_1172353 [Chytriomyces sp. MP71]|nr:hypothetical protein BC830DRAFT_1172353 [Chytriomyces sp. MP71]